MAFRCRKLIPARLNLYAVNDQINNVMETTSKKQHDADTAPQEPTPKIDESGSFNVSGYIRIFDPNTKETLVEARE